MDVYRGGKSFKENKTHKTENIEHQGHIDGCFYTVWDNVITINIVKGVRLYLLVCPATGGSERVIVAKPL